MKIKLKTLVAEFNNSKQGSQHDFARLYNIAVRGMRIFNIEIVGRTKTVILDVSDTKTVNIPLDCVMFSKAGVVDAFGKIYTFKRNERLTALRGDPSIGSTHKQLDNSIYANFEHGGSTYNLMGQALGTPTIGQYNVDEEAGVILLDFHNPYNQVAVEYIPDGHDDTAKDYYLDFRAETAFISWLRWQNAIDLRKQFSQSEIKGYMKEYYRDRRNCKIRMNPVIIHEMEQVRRESIKLVARA